MIHIYSGNGRGKTSIAIGTAIRMLGANKQVIFTQFMKGNDTSELACLKQLSGITILRVEDSFPFYKNMTQQDKEKITRQHNKILMQVMEQVMRTYGDIEWDETSGPSCLVVLDEITYPLQYGLIDEALFYDFLQTVPACVELILTGRNPLDKMLQFGDYWSEIEQKRHPYEKGIGARPGIEY